jgi:hypothetical protein
VPEIRSKTSHIQSTHAERLCGRCPTISPLPQPKVDLVTKKGLDVFLVLPYHHPRPLQHPLPPLRHVLRVCFLNNHLSSYFILLFKAVSLLTAETIPNIGLSVGRSSDVVLFSRLPLDSRVLTPTVNRFISIYPLNFSFDRFVSWKLRDVSESHSVHAEGQRGLRKLVGRIFLFFSILWTPIFGETRIDSDRWFT